MQITSYENNMRAYFQGEISEKKCVLYTAGKQIYMQYFMHDTLKQFSSQKWGLGDIQYVT